MIITLVNANFSSSNIGTLSTWTISRSLGTGATYSGPNFVDKDAALSATVTIADGYELGTAGVTVTMGGVAQENAATVNGNVITISIAAVTGIVMIKVPTINSETGEDTTNPDEGGDTTTQYLINIATLSENMAPTSSSPTLVSNTTYYSFSDIPVTPGETYRVQYARRVWEFNSNGEAINTLAAHKDVEDYTFTVTDNTTTMLLCISWTDLADPNSAILETL